MPWRETCVMDERMEFIVDWRRGETSFAELCRWYGISRKSGYKWLGRYAAEGVAGLEDRSRAPRHHPNAVSEESEAAIVAVRGRHPTWGPKKIRAWLMAHGGEPRWPVESVIAGIWRFVLVNIAVLALISYVPSISTALPRLLL